MTWQNELRIEQRHVSTLMPYANNPRTHTKKQIKQIADSIREFGWTNPVLIDADGNIIAGHGRIEAAKLLGMKEAPVSCLEHLSNAQKRAYIIADNKLAENAGWDSDLLAIELRGLLDLNIDFDIELTGFDTGEIDVLLESETAAEPETVPLPQTDSPAVNQPGDLWFIGKHRLLCGDALNEEAWQTLMGNDKAQMVFIDPPYNVPIAGHVSGLGTVKHREFAMASGEMSQVAFTEFLRGSFKNLAAYSADGSVHFICMDWRHMREVLDAADGIYVEMKNLCVWAKTNTPRNAPEKAGKY